MHGIQDSAKTAPSTGALASPAAGSLWMRHSRCSPGITPRKASPSTMISDADDDLDDVARAAAARGRGWRATTPVTVKTTVKPAMKPRRAEDDPAAGAAGRPVQGVVEVRAGQPGHVGQVARHQRQDARREEADQPGERRHPDGDDRAARRWRCSAKDSPTPSHHDSAANWLTTGSRSLRRTAAPERRRRPGPGGR